MAPRKGLAKRQGNSGRGGGKRNGAKKDGGSNSWLHVSNISKSIQKNVMGSAQSLGKCVKTACEAASMLGLDLSNFMYGPLLYGKLREGVEAPTGAEANARGNGGLGGGGNVNRQEEQVVEDERRNNRPKQLRPHTAQGKVEEKAKGKNKLQKVVKEASEVIRESVVVEKQARENLGLSQADSGLPEAAIKGTGSSMQVGADIETEEVSQAVPGQNVQVVLSSRHMQARVSVDVTGLQTPTGSKQMDEDLSPTPPEWKRARSTDKGLPAVPEETPSSRGNRLSSSEIDDEASDVTPHRIVFTGTALGTREAAQVVKTLVESVGGRHSVELGLHLEAGDKEVERWFLAALLFKNRLASDHVVPIYQRLRGAGIETMADIMERKSDELVQLLIKEGFSWRTAARLKRSGREMRAEIGDSISVLKDVAEAEEVEKKLQSLEGVGPVTCHLFLSARELRGIWAADVQAYSISAMSAAHHLHLIAAPAGERRLDIQHNPASDVRIGKWRSQLDEIAQAAGVDARDLSVALSRLEARHGRDYASCLGGLHCQG